MNNFNKPSIFQRSPSNDDSNPIQSCNMPEEAVTVSSQRYHHPTSSLRSVTASSSSMSSFTNNTTPVPTCPDPMPQDYYQQQSWDDQQQSWDDNPVLPPTLNQQVVCSHPRSSPELSRHGYIRNELSGVIRNTCSINERLPLEIIQAILMHVTEFQDIKNCRVLCKLWHFIVFNGALKQEVHVQLNSAVKAEKFVNDMELYSSIGARVDKVSVTTGHNDPLDLKSISSFCMNLKKLHFDHVDMNKYYKQLSINGLKLPNLQEIKIPKSAFSTNNGLFALSIYFRFRKVLVNLELSIDENLKKLLQKNYAGLDMFLVEFEQLKSLQLNYTCPQEMNCINLQPLLFVCSATIQKIVIDGVGELYIRNVANGNHPPRRKSELTEITIKSDAIDVQSLIWTINTLKGSRDMLVIDKLVIYSTFTDRSGDTVNMIMGEFLTYHQDHLSVDIANPVLLVNRHGTDACKWIITSTDNDPSRLHWSSRN